MVNDEHSNTINLSFKDDNNKNEPEQINKQNIHIDVGPSSLYGRIGDNLTYTTPGAYVHGHYERMWHWVWKEFFTGFFGLLRIFFASKK